MTSPPPPPTPPPPSPSPITLQQTVWQCIACPLGISVLLLLGVGLLYKLCRRSRQPSPPHSTAPARYSSDGGGAESEAAPLAPLPRQDMTLQQLAQYDGSSKEGRILVAVNHRVYDVTRGSRFYGPGGHYAVFAGKDASRGLATFSVNEVSGKYDDLSDLTSVQMESLREWDAQFRDRYVYVGKLLKPGEAPSDYTEESEVDSETDKKNQ